MFRFLVDLRFGSGDVAKGGSLGQNSGECVIRAFSSKNANILAFTISKSYFINFNIPLFNTPNIKHSIFCSSPY